MMQERTLSQAHTKTRPDTRQRIRVERGTLILLALFLLTLPLVTPRVAASDEIEYFSYLPSLLFDRDLNFRNQYEHFCNLDPRDCVESRFKETFLDQRTPTGLQINFGPIGTALLWSPFYLLAHFVALMLQSLGPAFAPDGYSPVYVYAVSLASVFYGWAGIWLAYRLARHYFEEWIALGAALVGLLATNAVYYMYVAPAFSHAASLFAAALFVSVWWGTRERRQRGEVPSWIALGASAALMTMVREQEAVFLAIPAVEGVRVLLNARREREWRRVRSFVAGSFVMLATVLVVYSPQFVVYKILNGNFLPAHNVTEKFTWDGAHIGDILFSNFHGLFTWTPVVLLSLIGLIFLWRRDRLLAAAFAVAFVAETFLLGSLSTRFGGAAFGMRRFINCPIIFVVGLAALADTLRDRVPRPALAAAGALLIVWNLFFIVQFATGMVPRQAPVDLLAMARNQVVGVPPRLAEIAWRFVTNRGSFYKR